MNLRPIFRPLWMLAVCAALSGCVMGYGRCLFLSPLRVSLTGTLHFRSYEVGGEVERVAVLSTDHSQYVYAPAESHLCRMADEFQLSGWSDYSTDLREGSRVSVAGSLIQATSPHQHTHFLIRLRSIEPLAHRARPASLRPRPPAR
ncbi:MAG: hypothetical protein HKM03_05070 [Steroidobacteraceae bacterium]|nr:hypothetical protein [Steroidobacteraceae bacterium]